MMGCDYGGWAGSGGLGHILGEIVAFLRYLASQILVVLTSGPALGLLAALVLVLAAIALLKVIFTRRAPSTRHTGSDGAPK